MLFSYGFIDQDMESAETLFLSLAIPDEDPSKISKIKFADCAPGFKIIDTSDQPAVGSETHESRSGDIDWTGDFIWLLCVGHEDGFQLRLARTVDGAEEVEATFQGETLSDARDLRRKLSQSSLWDVYRLRAVVILQQRVYDQLQVLYGTQEGIESLPRGDTTNIGELQYELATKLRRLEFGLLETAYEDFERQVSPPSSYFTPDIIYFASVVCAMPTQHLHLSGSVQMAIRQAESAASQLRSVDHFFAARRS